ncbi:MAG: hypothetical protein AAF629_32645 [Chloroflexota bacterium]
MAKKRKKATTRKSRTSSKALQSKAQDALEEVEWLISRKQWHQAQAALQSLDQKHPNRPKILTKLIAVCLELDDMRPYLYALVKLQKLQPKNPDLLFNLATAYTVNFYPALAVHTYQAFLNRHADHSQAAQAQESLVALEKTLEDESANLAPDDADPMTLAIGNDRLRLTLDMGQLREARQIASELLKLNPTLLPVINNLSLLEFLEGNLTTAIDHAEYVLEKDADNFQALGNLIRFLHLSGQIAAAQEKADLFETFQSDDHDIVLKKVETFTYLGDDHRIQKAVQIAENDNIIEQITLPALLYHFAAVAEMRLGNIDLAQVHWKRALEFDPNLEIARENVADLDKPIGEQHAPWPFPGNQWLPNKTFKDVSKVLETFAGKRSEKSRQKSMERLMAQHPELVWILPILLERGDPWGRDFASTFIFMTQSPSLMTALPGFALGQHGPDTIRHEAASIAFEAGLLPSKEIRMWLNGAWQDIMLLTFDVHYERDTEFDTPELKPWMMKLSTALNKDDADSAEEALKAILQIKHDSPSILNNLATVYQQQNKQDESQILIAQIQADYPDYFFGIITKASQLIIDKQFDVARETLQPLLLRDRLHISEFTALARIQIQLYLAEDKLAGAEQWLEMWDNINPDDPELDKWRFQVMSRDPSLMDNLRQAMGFFADFED